MSPIQRIKSAANSISEYIDGEWEDNNDGWQAIADSLFVAADELENQSTAARHRVYLLFGDSAELHTADHITEFAFDTKAELNAFLQGVAATSGWLDCHQFDTEREAIEFCAG